MMRVSPSSHDASRRMTLVVAWLACDRGARVRRSTSARLCMPRGCVIASTFRFRRSPGASPISFSPARDWLCSSTDAFGTAAPSTLPGRRAMPITGGRRSKPIDPGMPIPTSGLLFSVGRRSGSGNTKTPPKPRTASPNSSTHAERTGSIYVDDHR